MSENKHDSQPDRQLTPEEQLDLLLEQFLNDPDDTIPTLPKTEDIHTELSQDDTAAMEEFAESIAATDSAADQLPELDLEQPDTDTDPDVIADPCDNALDADTPQPEAQSADGETAATEAPEAENPDFTPEPTVEEQQLPREEMPENTFPEFQEETAEGESLEDVDIENLLSSLAVFANDPAPSMDTFEEEEDLQPEDSPTEAEAGAAQPEDSLDPSAPESDGEEQESDDTQQDPPAEDPSEDTDDTSSDQTDEETEEDADQASEEPEPPKKRRPRNNKAYGFLGIPHMLSTLVWLAIVVFIGVGLGTFIWNCAADVLALGAPDSEVVITIDESDTLETLAAKLKKTGLIRYSSLFVIYGEISDAMDSIRPGSYTLNTRYDYHALVDTMSSNQKRITANVTIPEGFTCGQIFQLLENKGITTVEKLEEAAANADLGEYWFLEGVERGTANCLEGFLFPDTYTFYLDHDPVSVLQKFLDNFSKRFNDALRIKLDTLNMTISEMMRANGLSEEYIAAHQMTARDVVIVASLIEKETASIPESYNIASVIYNRLTNPNQFPCLQIDAALIYYTGRSEITREDLVTDHPYNTYTRPGLTIAGPISNPGSYSLDAALDPAESDYYFYALDPETGAHHFSKTLQEHDDFLASLKKEEE